MTRKEYIENIIEDGWQSARIGYDFYDNPYEEFTEEWIFWLTGFIEQ